MDDLDAIDAQHAARMAKIESDHELRMRLFWRFLVPCGVILIIGIWWFQSAMEAAAYNRVTGKDISTWDAMWVELRVQEGAK